jgi:hypothetical protein
MSLVQRNDVVEQFAAAASDPTLRNAVLPRAGCPRKIRITAPNQSRNSLNMAAMV